MKIRTISLMLIVLVAAAMGAVAGEKASYCTVCGYAIDAKTAVEKTRGDMTFRFCCESCAACFDRHGDRIAAGRSLDPVCGMEFDRAKGVRAVVGEREVWFCSETCRDTFVKTPEKYAKACLVKCEKGEACCGATGPKRGCGADTKKKASAGCGGCAADGCKHPG